MKKIFLSLLLAALMPALFAQAAPVDMVTKDCAFYVQADRVDGLLTEIEGYARQFGATLEPGQLKALVSLQMLGQIGFPGLDLSRPVGVYLLYKNKAFSGGVAMVPVTSEQTFRAIVLARLAASQLPLQFRDGYAIIASDAAAMQAFQNGEKKPVTLVRDAQLSFYIDMSLFKDEVARAMDEMAKNRTGRESRVAKSLMGFYVEWLRDLRGINYALTLKPHGLELGVAVGIAPDGKLARLLGSTPKGTPELIARMPADSYFVAASRCDFAALTTYYDPLFAVFNAVERTLGDTLKETMREAAEVYGDDFAMAAAPGGTGGIALVGAARIQSGSVSKSQAMYAALVRKLNELPTVQRIKRNNGTFNVVYTRGAGRVGGTSYDLLKIDFTVPETLGEQDRKSVQVVRDLLTIRIARVGDVEYWALGGDSERRLGQMIAGTAGFKSSAAWATLTATYGQYEKNGIFYFSVTEMLRDIVKVSKAVRGGDTEVAMLGRILEQIPAGRGGIFAIAAHGGNTATMRALVSKDEILNIVKLVSTMLTMNKTM